MLFHHSSPPLERSSVFRYARWHHGCPRLLCDSRLYMPRVAPAPNVRQTSRHVVACHIKKVLMEFLSSPVSKHSCIASLQANDGRAPTQDVSSASRCPDPLSTSLPFSDVDVNRRPITNSSRLPRICGMLHDGTYQFPASTQSALRSEKT